jgi:hypothetical protein
LLLSQINQWHQCRHWKPKEDVGAGAGLASSRHDEKALLALAPARLSSRQPGCRSIAEPGTILEHEAVGVEELGKDVRNLRKGDRVVVPSTISCGYCSYRHAGYQSSTRQSRYAGNSGRAGKEREGIGKSIRPQSWKVFAGSPQFGA